MKKIELSAISKHRIKKMDYLHPIDLVEYTETALDNSHPPIEIDGLTFKVGALIRDGNKALFKHCCNEYIQTNIDLGYWVKLHGKIYEAGDIRYELELMGFELEFE
jgi:hypothetical protein